MKLLAFSDLHSHNHKAFAEYKDGVNTRLLSTLSVLEQIQEAASDVDATIFLGDLFHVSPPPTNVFNRTMGAMEALAGSTPHLYLIPGNHDLKPKIFGDVEEVPFLYLTTHYPNVSLLDGGDTRKGVRLVGIPHGRIEETRTRIKEEKKVGGDILLLHQDIKDAQVGGYKFTDGISAEDTEGWDWVLCGHIHKPQKLADNFIIVGAPLHTNFGDSGDRGFWILDTEKDTAEFVKTLFPKFVSVSNPSKVKEDGNFYRVVESEDKGSKIVLPSMEEAISSYADQAQLNAHIGIGISKEVSCDQYTPSNWRVDDVSLKNFCSYKNTSFRLTKGVSLVTGKYDTNDAKSNGAGKSALFECVSWVLFNRTSKGETAVVRRGAKSCECTLRLIDDAKGRIMHLTRKKAKTSKLTIELSDSSGSKKLTQEELEIELGVSYDFFSQMVYFSQASASFMSSMGDADRKKLLGLILGLSWYDAAKSVAKEDRVKEEEKKQQAQMQIVAKESEVVSLRNAINDSLSRKESLIEKQIKEQEDRKKNEESLRDKISVLVTRIEEKEKEAKAIKLVDLSEANDRVDKAQKALAEARQRYSDCNERLQGFKAQLKSKKQEQGRVQKELDALNKTLTAISNREVGVRCPACGSVVSEESIAHCEEEVFLKIDEVLGRQERLNYEMDTLDMDIEVCETEQAKNIEDGTLTKDEVEAAQKVQKKGMESNYKRKEILSAISSLSNELDNCHTQCDALISTPLVTENLLDEWKVSHDKLCENEKTILSELKTLKGSLENFDAMVEELRGWEKAFGREGIPALLLEGFCTAFTREVNDVFARISYDITIELSSSTTLKSGEERERLQYKILTPSGETSYKSLSGGERTMVDLASMLALNRMASRQFGIEEGVLGMLVLDEVFSFLDEENCEYVYDLISQFPARSVYVVTHDSYFKSMFSNFVVVSKTNGVSEVC